MPLPLILGIGAAIAGLAGAGSGIHGAVKMKEANDTMQAANLRHESNKRNFKRQSDLTTTTMDTLGKKELEILSSFDDFTRIFEKIQNKPEFETYYKSNVDTPKYNSQELRKVSVGAGVLLGGIGGAAAGTAGGFAAAGATTSAVMALGTASTGTAIASLSGIAATNATLATLGGGVIGVGGGMALGTTILGAATLGVGILIGGVIFNVTGSTLSDKADEAWEEMKKAEKEIDKICPYLKQLRSASSKFYLTLTKVDDIYSTHLRELTRIIEDQKKTEWNTFSTIERTITENTVLLTGLLYKMCKVEIVLASKNKNDINKVNSVDIDKSISDAEKICYSIGFGDI